MQAGDAVALLRSSLDLARAHYGARDHPACLALLLDVADGLGVVAGAAGSRVTKLQEGGDGSADEAQLVSCFASLRLAWSAGLDWSCGQLT